MRHAALTLSMLFALLAASTASAGVIRGTLWMSRAGSLAVKGAPESASILKAQRGVTDAVLYLEQVPDKVEHKLSGTGWFIFFRATKHVPRMVQMNRQFTPRVMAVPAGTSVEFRNMDAVYHNAFSVSPAKRFDLGKYPPGKSDTVGFDRTGVVNLHCDIHPDMFAYIVVTPNHAFARPDSLGRYRLPNLPAGRYTVQVFHPQRGEIRRDVEMPRHGDLTLDLTF